MWLRLSMPAGPTTMENPRTRSDLTEQTFPIHVNTHHRNRCLAANRKHGSCKDCERLRRPGNSGGIQLGCSIGVWIFKICPRILGRDGLTLVMLRLATTTGQRIVTSGLRY